MPTDPPAPVSREEYVTLDVTVRVHTFGKPEVVSETVKAAILREVGHAYPEVEIRKVARAGVRRRAKK
jgi:hypothetical protein